MQYTVSGTDCVSIDGDERYPFLTAEAAKLFAGILNRDQANYYTPPGASFYAFMPDGACTNAWATVVRSGNREVVCMQDGVITTLDMPYLVWCWLRTTAPVRVAKALWKGWA